MPQQKLDLALKGLFTGPNNLSAVPQGALEVADNVVIDKPNIVESRRGQTQYGTNLSIGAEQVNKIFNYASSLVVNYDSKMAYDSDGSGTWIDYSGTYLAPSTDLKMKALEAAKNFYFTTSTGVYKLDSITSTPRKTGVVKALSGTATASGAAGFMVTDSAVAYRLVWGYVDTNDNLILGAPSQRLVVTNNSGVSIDVTLTYTIPDSITTEYFYQIYRSTGSVSYTTEPDDELQLVAQGNPTSGEITAKSFTVTDITPYSLMRASLYTNPSQEGIANSNNEPPLALDIDIFKTSAWYANITQKQSFLLTNISVVTPSFGFYTDASVGTHSNTTLDTIASTTNLRVGMRCVGTGIPDNTTILSILGSNSIQMSAAATATASVSVEFQDRISIGGVDYWAGSTNTVATNTFKVDSSGSVSQNINATCLNMINIINTSASNTTLYGYYISALDDLPGQMQFEERSVGGSVFYVTSTAGSSFSPVLPTSGSVTLNTSTNGAKQNRVFLSKPGQVEAVPAYTYYDIGSANFGIDRIVALRDGLFIFKHDGIFRISGEGFSSYTVALIDSTTTIKVPDSAVAFNNQVFMFCDQGIAAVTDSGAQIMSIPIENTLLELSSEQYTHFASASFGVGYESSRQYMFFTVTDHADTFATQAFIYNSLTKTWTRWIMNRTSGVVSNSTNKLIMSEADSGQILIERKNFTNSDYADKQHNVTILSIDSDTTMTLDIVALVEVGMTIQSGSGSSLISAINDTVLTVESTIGFDTGPGIVYEPIINEIQWAPIDCENPGILKQFSEVSFFFRNAAFQTIDAKFSSNILVDIITVPLTNLTLRGWGDTVWGETPWGGSLGAPAVIRTYVPPNQQRASWLTVGLKTEEAFTGFSLQGVSLIYNPMTSRIK